MAIWLDIYLAILVFLIIIVFCLSGWAIILKMVCGATGVTPSLIVVILGRRMRVLLRVLLRLTCMGAMVLGLISRGLSLSLLTLLLLIISLLLARLILPGGATLGAGLPVPIIVLILGVSPKNLCFLFSEGIRIASLGLSLITRSNNMN